MAKLAALSLKQLKNYADWKLLVFLVLFLNVKLAVKIPAIALIYILQADFKLGLRLKNPRLPLFYLLVISIAIVNWVFNKNDHHFSYALVLVTGIGFWLLCLLASHQLKYAVEHTDAELIHRTILLFFILNAAVSFCNIAAIIWETGSANPYLYQGQYQKYFIGTGDYIRGISFDTSTTNSLLSAFGVAYFLTRKNAVMVCVCMLVLLLTGSNFINIAIVFIFLLLFFFRSDKDQKSLIFICIAFLAIFMAKVSPQNNGYAIQTFKNTFLHRKIVAYVTPPQSLPITVIPDNLLSPDERKEKTAQLFIDSVNNLGIKKVTEKGIAQTPVAVPAEQKLALPKPDINTKPYQTRTDTDAEQRRLLGFIDLHKTRLPLSGQEHYKVHVPGKAIGLFQTLSFLQHHPTRSLLGDGMGNFSSKLAFRASGLGFSGGYPHKYIYINPDFLTNHLDIYLNFFSKRPGLHSLTNSPYSTYDQLLAEYGIIGLLAFLIGYLWFFAKHYKTLTYGLPVLILMAGGFFIEYWFEQLSVVLFFELLLFLDIKEHHKVLPLQPIEK